MAKSKQINKKLVVGSIWTMISNKSIRITTSIVIIMIII